MSLTPPYENCIKQRLRTPMVPYYRETYNSFMLRTTHQKANYLAYIFIICINKKTTINAYVKA